MPGQRGFARPAAVESRRVPDDALLTQYGREVSGHPTFRSRPRFPDEHDLSMLWGVLTPNDAASAVRGRPGDENDRARHCSAGALRAAGFVVVNTPTRRNPDHVSVLLPGEPMRWDDDVARAFELVMQEGE